MKTAIAPHVLTGSFFDLDRKDPDLIRLREVGAESALPFALMERLVKSGTRYAEHARSLRSDNVTVAGANFDWFEAELPGEINLTDYEIVQHTDERRAALTQALDRLSLVHPEGFARVCEFVRSSWRRTSRTRAPTPAVRYLMRELELLSGQFSPHGVDLLADLRHQTDQL